jgi:hypothetical protein
VNRRTFFKWLGIGTAAAVVAPSVPIPEPVDANVAEIAGWVSYRFHYTVSLPPEKSSFLKYKMVL